MPMVNSLLALLALATASAGGVQAGSGDAQLGVTATVVRPVEIAEVEGSAERPVLVIRNAEAVLVEAAGGTVASSDEAATVTSDGTALMAVTLTY